MRVVLGTVALLCLAFATGAVLGEEDGVRSLIDRLEGRWRGTGTLLGQSSAAELVFERVLSDRFLRLELRNTMTSAEGAETLFAGDAYYALEGGGSDGLLRGRWFDSRGIALPIRARIEGDALISDWGSEETERGRTTYRLEGATLVVVDEVLADGELREFGRVTYERD